MTPDVALVTGGTGGIGAAINERLVSEGWRVLAADFTVDKKPDGLGSEIVDFPMDVRNDASISEAVEAAASMGRLRGIVNCAGVLREARADEMPEEAADAMWQTNVLGAGRVVRTALPHMADGGSVVNISSIVGSIGRFAGTAMYSASKAALEGFTRVLACELAPRSVRVNAIAPGFIRVPMAPQWEKMSGGESALEAQVPLGRLGEPAEIADAVEYLLSGRSSYVTGIVLFVDGGVEAW